MLSDIIDILSPDAVESIYAKEEQTRKGKKHFVRFKFKKLLSENKFSVFLSEWIIKNYEKKIMQEILKLNFMSLTTEDITAIINMTENKIDDNIHKEYNKIITQQLLEFLSRNNTLNIDGFIRFRLKDYRLELEELLYDTIDEYLAEKEYEAFIDMLCTYVENQYPTLELIHIREKNDGSFSLYDFSQNNISIICEDELNAEMPEAFLNHEDRLMNILLILVPKRIIWHKSSKSEHGNFLKVIQRIFKDKLSICYDCE